MAKMTVRALINSLEASIARGELTDNSQVAFRDPYTEEDTPLVVDCALPQSKRKAYLTWHPDYIR